MRILERQKRLRGTFAELIIHGRCQLFIYAASGGRKRQREAIYAKTIDALVPEEWTWLRTSGTS